MSGQLDVLVASTEAFIADDPTTIVLTPHTKVRGPNGTKLVPATPRAAQTFKVIRMSASQKPTVTVDGVARVADVTLVGMPDAIVDVYDTWTESDGVACEVVSVVPYERYQVKVLAERRG